MTPSLAHSIRQGQAVVAGSLAFDNIMDFPGHFKDHILTDKAHVINISFLVDRFTQQRGGCAGNIAYTLALLGEPPRVIGAVGDDFGDYLGWLIRHKIDVSGIQIFDDERTASCFITTDKANCQITGFHVGAMKRAREISFSQLAGKQAVIGVVAPDDPEAMMRHCREAREAGIPVLFDPSFQVTAMDGDYLKAADEGAWGLIVNDYEFAVFREKTGRSAEELRRAHHVIIVTYGADGSELLLADGATIKIPAAHAAAVVDPTGAGDAYRGGFVAGLVRGYDLEVCGRMGSLAAACCIEHYGTQSHRYTQEEFFGRYRQDFGPAPID